MGTSMVPPPPGKVNFAGMVSAKRRRLRSGGNVTTISNNSPKSDDDYLDMEDDDQTAQSSKCKGATTIPIFLKKTYKMIDTCDPNIACWTPDGEMFVVKDPDLFAQNVIPQYFDHNKFSSFARQLNFYGFRKMQSKPIKNSDFDANTAKHVTFYNENFKRGRCDLLKKIQRSTRGSNNTSGQDQSREISILRENIATLENTISEMGNQMEERMRRLELDMLGRMEQMMLAMQQQGPTKLNGNNSADAPKAPTSNGSVNGLGGWDPLPFGARGTSIGSISGLASLAGSNSLGMNGMNRNGGQGGPTLPPHPKQKSLPPQGLPGALGIPPTRLETLRGISNLSREFSGLTRGTSLESQSSAVLFGNDWESKFFNMLMSGEKAQQSGGTGMTNPSQLNQSQMAAMLSNIGNNNGTMGL